MTQEEFIQSHLYFIVVKGRFPIEERKLQTFKENQFYLLPFFSLSEQTQEHMLNHILGGEISLRQMRESSLDVINEFFVAEVATDFYDGDTFPFQGNGSRIFACVFAVESQSWCFQRNPQQVSNMMEVKKLVEDYRGIKMHWGTP